MRVRVGNLVFDAPGASLDQFGRTAGEVATMYAELLGMRRCSRADVYREAGYPADEGDEVDPLLISHDPSQPSIAFEWEKGEYHPPHWPRARAEALGARRLEYLGGGFVFADPAGHPFCLGE